MRTSVRGEQILDGSIQSKDCDSSIEKTINKGAVSGYAPLDSNSLVPTDHIAVNTADNNTFLRGDQTWVRGSSITAALIYVEVIDSNLTPTAGGPVLEPDGDGNLMPSFTILPDILFEFDINDNIIPKEA